MTPYADLTPAPKEQPATDLSGGLLPSPQVTCICCDKPSDPTLPGDLDLCVVCFNIISAPWSGESDELLW